MRTADLVWIFCLLLSTCVSRHLIDGVETKKINADISQINDSVFRNLEATLWVWKAVSGSPNMT